MKKIISIKSLNSNSNINMDFDDYKDFKDIYM